MKCAVSKNVRALTLIEVLIIVAVLMLLAALLLSFAPRQPHYSRMTACANNLKQIGLCFRVWAGDNGDKFPMEVSATNGGSLEFVGTSETFRHFQVLSNEMSNPRIAFCPADTNRSYAVNFTSDFSNSKISYFIVVTPTENDPTAPMAGDRNLTLNGAALTNGWHFLGTNGLVGWSREIHNRQGNVLMADGSVQQVSSNDLLAIFQHSSMSTNHLAIP